MVKDLIEGFNQVVDKAKDLEREFQALTDIKNRCNEKLKKVNEEIKGLDKALTYASISYEAKKVIEAKIISCKELANRFNCILENKSLYEFRK